MSEPWFRRVQLDNGLRLLHHRTRRVPLVSVNAFFLAGKDQNPLEWPGLASLTARLLEEGTEGRSHRKISQTLESIGAEISSFSEREISGVSLTLQSRHLAIGLELLAEMVQRPTFPKARIELERHQVVGHLQSMADDPQLVGSQRLNHWIYNSTPLAEPVLGTVESISGISRAQLQDFHLRKYGPWNCLVVIVGDIDLDAASELVGEQFGDWRNPAQDLVIMDGLARQSKPVLDTFFMDKEQVNLYLGHLGITRRNPDYYAVQVMDTILGGGPGFTSRIPRRLRDEWGLAYLTYADLAGSAGIYPGRFVAYIGTAPENVQRAREALQREIVEFVEGGPRPEELDAAQAFLTGNFVFELQSNLSVARLLLLIEVFELSAEYPDRYPDLIRSVTLSDVSRVARRYLDTLNYTTVIVGAS